MNKAPIATPPSLLQTAFTGVGLFIFIGTMLVIAVLWSLPLALAEKLTHEGHVVETVTAVVLGVAVLVGIRQLWANPSLCWGSAVVILIWTVLRELDFQRNFTPRSMESFGFFTSKAIPLEMKLWVSLAMIPFVLAGFCLFKNAIKNARSLLRERPLWLRMLVVGTIYALIARFFEKARIDRAHILEEVGELSFAFFLVLAVYYFPRFKAPRSAQDESVELAHGEAQLPASANHHTSS